MSRDYNFFEKMNVTEREVIEALQFHSRASSLGISYKDLLNIAIDWSGASGSDIEKARLEMGFV